MYSPSLPDQLLEESYINNITVLRFREGSVVRRRPASQPTDRLRDTNSRVAIPYAVRTCAAGVHVVGILFYIVLGGGAKYWLAAPASMTVID